MKMMKTLVAAAAFACALQANAVPVVSIGVAPGSYIPFSLAQLDAGYVNTSVQTGSAANQWLAPVGVGSTPYMVVSVGGEPTTNGSASISFAPNLNNYSFLWGSPDEFNKVVFTLADSTTFTYTGANLGTLGSFSANGNNANTKWVTFSANGGPSFTNATFMSSGVAFEVANVSPVPEPETYALMLAGLAAMGFVANRRRR